MIHKSNENFRETIEKESIFKRLLYSKKLEEVDEKFNEMKNNIEQVSKKIDLSLYQKINREEAYANINEHKVDTELSQKPKLNFSGKNSNENTYKNEFTSVIQQYFDIKKCLIDQLLNIKKILGVKYNIETC